MNIARVMADGYQDSPLAYLLWNLQKNHLQVQMVGLMFLPQLSLFPDLVWGLVAGKTSMKTVKDKGLISGQILGLSYILIDVSVSYLTQALSLSSESCYPFPIPELDFWFQNP